MLPVSRCLGKRFFPEVKETQAADVEWLIALPQWRHASRPAESRKKRGERLIVFSHLRRRKRKENFPLFSPKGNLSDPYDAYEYSGLTDPRSSRKHFLHPSQDSFLSHLSDIAFSQNVQHVTFTQQMRLKSKLNLSKGKCNHNSGPK